MCVCYGVSYVTEFRGSVSDMNADAVKNDLCRCKLLFSDVLDVFATMCNHLQTCLQLCYENGERNLSNKHNYL